MTPAQHLWLAAILARISLARAVETVSQWCCREIVFNEPDCRGLFSLAGREYLREPLDNWGIEEVTDQVCVMAPRTGKTRVLYGGLGWTIVHAPSRILYVKPKTKGAAGAEDDARTRFIPMLRASPVLAKLIPNGGNKRHEFKTPQQIIGGAIVDWVGSNSVASLASNPCRIVPQDEVDKFNATRKRDDQGNVVEADASALADERCKEFANPKRFKASTPTLTNGRIWQELTQKSDFRRYFIPCPHCGKHVVLAWSEDFTVLPKTGCEAFVKWDPAAKVGGAWDEAKVESSAHFVCPHCKGEIRDEHKPAMIAAGEWRSTRQGQPGYRGYHLPAMYALHAQCNVGKLAVRFLAAVRSVEGPRAFINNDLAEPYGGQDIAGKRIERVSQIEVGDEWRKLMTVDCQAVAPYFWYVVRAFAPGKSIGLECGSVDTWEELRTIQLRHKVLDEGVVVDSGYGAKDDHEVYRTCAKFSKLERDATTGKVWCFGWMPSKSFDGRKTWPDPETGIPLHYKLRDKDPFEGTADAGKVWFQLFEYGRDHYLDILERLRTGKAKGFEWTISTAMDTEEYRKHMRGRMTKTVFVGTQAVRKWTKRYAHAPDHLYACEEEHVAYADQLGWLGDVENETEKKEEEQKQ